MTNIKKFTVINGGRDKQITLNTVSLKIVPGSLSSLPVDVRVFEEDTFLVLTVDPVLRYTEEHPIRLMTKVVESKPNKPGSIVMNNSSWYAVIHDLDIDPTWKKEWIEKAYHQVLMLAELKRIKKIGLPLLGSVHGNFPYEQSMEILINAVKKLPFQYLRKILIITLQQDCEATWKNLQKLNR